MNALICKHVLSPGYANCLHCGERILYSAPVRTRWQTLQSILYGVGRALSRRIYRRAKSGAPLV
jgi:hypothetical protein